jgi:hypothetical protein
VEGSVSNAQADQAAQELGVSRSLVYRLVARYRKRAQTSSLLSVPRGRAEQTQWLDKEVETLIRSAVERIYLQREQPRVSDLFRAIKADCQRFALKPPSYNTVHARLLSLDPKEVTRRRIGAAAARQRFTPVPRSAERQAFQFISRRALPKFQVSGSDRRSGNRHVDPSRGGPKVFEGLLELLNDFADWLGLCAHTLPLFELCPRV